jgi:hypothetical protein
MKTRIFILTYDRPKILNLTLDSIFSSDAYSHIQDNSIELFIINNYSILHIEDQFKNYIKVINNETRPDFSTGHLSRSWNEALILGFENLLNPACDLVITLQDDVLLNHNWYEKLLYLHKEKGLHFIQNGHGDAFCSYTVEAVKRVGLWDERFLFGMQAADYFYRQLMFNYEDCTINDPIHGRVHNEIIKNNIQDSTSFLVKDNFIGTHWTDPTDDIRVATKLLELKYGSINYLNPWSPENKELSKTMTFKTQNYIFYSYFEKDVYDLKKKGYIF